MSINEMREIVESLGYTVHESEECATGENYDWYFRLWSEENGETLGFWFQFDGDKARISLKYFGHIAEALDFLADKHSLPTPDLHPQFVW